MGKEADAIKQFLEPYRESAEDKFRITLSISQALLFFSDALFPPSHQEVMLRHNLFAELPTRSNIWGIPLSDVRLGYLDIAKTEVLVSNSRFYSEALTPRLEEISNIVIHGNAVKVPRSGYKSVFRR